MAFLHEKIAALSEAGAGAALPSYIPDNLNPAFELRPYQKQAFENFITYYESSLRRNPTQVLFHMATGSGKTLIMAGLMLYLYKQGYRDFLFFVNLSNILEKTKENFGNAASAKYLFGDEIILEGERIEIQPVTNFQYSDPGKINICFSTTQGLHMDLWTVRENGMSLDDFDGRRVVLISDEAHHLNVDTRKKMSVEESESYHSWEQTVKNIFYRNAGNVLLEFTATCDLADPAIKAAYEDKIIFDYALRKFYRDKYTKNIFTLRSDLAVMDRGLQALVLSQYRLKVFQDNRLSVKPVVLFKAAKIRDSKEFMGLFLDTLGKLSGSRLRRLSAAADNPVMRKAFEYFARHGISLDSLAQELREDFGEEHCWSVNDDKDAMSKQLLLNSLEDADNPYLAIFEVKKLDEGWDVLNLFDIVRLYDAVQSDGRKTAPATIAEAQLIGRGARYCPFRVEERQPRFQRKYDDDPANEMRICEELYYHCRNDRRYITELHNALGEIGLDTDKALGRGSILKDGTVSVSPLGEKDRGNMPGLPPGVRNALYTYRSVMGVSNRDALMEPDFGADADDAAAKLKTARMTIGEIADINYAIVNKALMKYPVYKFHILKSYFPDLTSTRQFITGEDYLGRVRIDICSRDEKPGVAVMYDAVFYVLGKIAGILSVTFM